MPTGDHPEYTQLPGYIPSRHVRNQAIWDAAHPKLPPPPVFNPEMFWMAIDVRGGEPEEVAEETGIHIIQIYRYLNGLDVPNEFHLSRIGHLLQFPRSFFFQEGKREYEHIFHCKMPDWAGAETR